MSLRFASVTGSIASQTWSDCAPAGQNAHTPSWIVTGLTVGAAMSWLAST